ncbi:MAG: FHA domain-containing protein [Anaerolineae bacterium]|nr:FHA domain-containing protein [Anaerolineae bacterium]
MTDLQLIATWSDGRVEVSLLLFGQTVRVGHDAYNDIQLPVHFRPPAPYHAIIYPYSGNYCVDDPAGVGSVYLNGKRLRDPAYIPLGVPIYIGHPLDSPLYLRMTLEHMQVTQAMQTPPWEAPTISRTIEQILQGPTEEVPTVPYLRFGWRITESLTVPLEQEVTIVGRSPAANIVLPSHLRFLSALHFQIMRTPHGFFLVDKESTNGTRVNRGLVSPRSPVRLHDGDIISIQGDDPDALAWFIFHDPHNPKPPEDPPPLELPAANEPAPSLWARVRRFLLGGE